MLTLEEERKKVVEAINATFEHLGAGLTDLLTDSRKLSAAVAGLTLLALGVYSTREGVRVAGRTFDRWFGTPRLVCPLHSPGHVSGAVAFADRYSCSPGSCCPRSTCLLESVEVCNAPCSVE